MSTGVTTKSLSQLQKMTDEQFANVLIGMASIALPAGGISSGFFARLALTKVGSKFIGFSSSKFGLFIYGFLGNLAASAINGENPFAKQAIISLIFDVTGLELETLDQAGVKKAVGKYLSDYLNERYDLAFEPLYPLENLLPNIGAALALGINQQAQTEFTNVYPPSLFLDELKTQAIADLESGAGKIFSSQDVASLIAGLNKIRDSELSGELLAYGGIKIAQTPTIQADLAYRRAQGRARSREYARTHKRDYTWQPKT